MRTSKSKQAHKLSQRYHHDQKDKAGRPYIEHLEFVADHVTGEDEKTVAYLHDIIEDTDMTREQLAEKFSGHIVEAVEAITHRPGEDYMDYVHRAGEDPLSCAVKIADLTNNMMLDRLPNITEKDYARLEKYKAAYDYLTQKKCAAENAD